MEGWQFLGGDPADQANWKPVTPESEKSLDRISGGEELPEGATSEASALPEDAAETASPNLADKGHMIPGHKLPPALAGEMASAIPFADELVSGAGALVQSGVNSLTGSGPTSVTENFAQNQAFDEAQRAANAERAPNATVASQIASGLMLAGRANPNAAPSAFQAIFQGTTKRQMISGGAAGGAVAGLYGLGEGASGFSKEDLDQRIDSAKEMALSGSGIGTMFPLATKFVGAVAGLGVNALNQLKGNTMRSFAREMGVSGETLKRIIRGYDDTAGGLSPREDGDMLLDLSPQFMGQAEAIAQQPGRAGQVIEQSVLFRKNRAGQRIKDVIDQTIGTNPGRAIMKKAMTDEQKQAGRMLETAKNSGILLNVTSVRSKLNEAADILALGDDEVRALLDRVPEGMIPAGQMHQIRMKLDSIIEKGFNEGGNKSATAFALKDVRREADVQLRKLAGWSDANKAYSVAKKTQSAFADGDKVFANNAPDPSEIAQEIAELRAISPRVAESFIAGARNRISTWMGTARNDAGKVVAELAQKGWNAEKLELLVGKKQSDRLLSTLQREKRFQDTSNKITGNSATARRIQGQKEFPSSVSTEAEMNDLMKSSLGGVVMAKTKRLATILTGNRGAKKRAKISEEFADVITKTGMDLDEVLNTLGRIEQIQGRKVTVKDAWRAITQATLPAASIAVNQ